MLTALFCSPIHLFHKLHQRQIALFLCTVGLNTFVLVYCQDKEAVEEGLSRALVN